MQHFHWAKNARIGRRTPRAQLNEEHTDVKTFSSKKRPTQQTHGVVSCSIESFDTLDTLALQEHSRSIRKHDT